MYEDPEQAGLSLSLRDWHGAKIWNWLRARVESDQQASLDPGARP